MEAEDRREAEEHAQRERERGPVRRVVRVEQLLEPATGCGWNQPSSLCECGLRNGRIRRAAVRCRRRARRPVRWSAVSSPILVSVRRRGPAGRRAAAARGARRRNREQQLVVVAAGKAGRQRDRLPSAREPAPRRRVDRQRAQPIARAGPARFGDLPDGVRKAVAEVHARRRRPRPARGARRSAPAAPAVGAERRTRPARHPRAGRRLDRPRSRSQPRPAAAAPIVPVT